MICNWILVDKYTDETNEFKIEAMEVLVRFQLVTSAETAYEVYVVQVEKQIYRVF